jgi:hypothetical protein
MRIPSSPNPRSPPRWLRQRQSPPPQSDNAQGEVERQRNDQLGALLYQADGEFREEAKNSGYIVLEGTRDDRPWHPSPQKAGSRSPGPVEAPPNQASARKGRSRR